jgi:hypothetical protein
VEAAIRAVPGAVEAAVSAVPLPTGYAQKTDRLIPVVRLTPA